MAQIRLRTGSPAEIRRTLTRVMNMVVNKQIDKGTANTIILGCNAILSSIRTDEQEKKINQLEALLNTLK